MNDGIDLELLSGIKKTMDSAIVHGPMYMEISEELLEYDWKNFVYSQKILDVVKQSMKARGWMK